jgi:hypothetical protein
MTANVNVTFKPPCTSSPISLYSKLPANTTLPPRSQIYRPTRTGGEALAKFIKDSQACARPRRREPSEEEDYG